MITRAWVMQCDSCGDYLRSRGDGVVVFATKKTMRECAVLAQWRFTREKDSSGKFAYLAKCPHCKDKK